MEICKSRKDVLGTAGEDKSKKRAGKRKEREGDQLGGRELNEMLAPVDAAAAAPASLPSSAAVQTFNAHHIYHFSHH
jgi:hypothetical protein